MHIIGICGGSGSGKGYLSRRLAEAGIPVYDCDAEYHRMISCDSPVTREIASAFGEAVLDAGGGISRSALRDHVFAHDGEEKRLLLNRIAHAHVKEDCLKWAKEKRRAGSSVVAVDAPLLFEAGFDAFCDMIVAVTAPLELRIERITKRDGIDPQAALRRMQTQIPDEVLVCRADFVFQNNSDPNAFEASFSELMTRIQKR